MRVFVTGGNGFIGSAVVRRLIGSGHEVTLLLRAASDTSRIEDLPFDRIQGDVRDLDALRAGVARADCTIHLAAPGGWDAGSTRALTDVIVGGVRNVLRAASEQSRHRVVHVSTSAAINGSDTPRVFDERSEFTLRNRSLGYALAKHQAELLVQAACERGADVVVVNPAEVYGPGDIALGTAGNLIDFARASPVLVCDGGTSVVHVDDVATGIVAALHRGRSGERYILGGENLSVRAMAELVLELTGRRAPIVRVPTGVARAVASVATMLRIPLPFNPYAVPYATRYWFMDTSKARRELGVAFRDARATIGSTLAWLRETDRLA